MDGNSVWPNPTKGNHNKALPLVFDAPSPGHKRTERGGGGVQHLHEEQFFITVPPRNNEQREIVKHIYVALAFYSVLCLFHCWPTNTVVSQQSRFKVINWATNGL